MGGQIVEAMLAAAPKHRNTAVEREAILQRDPADPRCFGPARAIINRR